MGAPDLARNAQAFAVQLLLLFTPPLARILQRHRRIHAKRDPALLPVESVLQSPPSTTGRVDQQIETARIAERVRALQRLGAADLRFSEPVTPSRESNWA